MAKTRQELFLKIEQSGRIVQHRMTGRDRVSIGQREDCDITVYGEQFPKKHILFDSKNNHFQVRLKDYMTGEVLAGKSQLSFDALIAHELLPRTRDNYTYPITLGKRGYITVGDARISFQVIEASTEKTVAFPEFKGYSWTYATLNHIKKDIHFKLILLFFVILNTFLVRYMDSLPLNLNPQPGTDIVPDRLAKIIVRNQPVETQKSRRSAVGNEDETDAETGQEDAQPEQAERGPQNVRPENQGLLGLLTGTGRTEQSSSLTDFLIDKKLVKELDEVMTSTDLRLGKGNTVGEQLDALIATSETGGGIDDILSDVSDVQPFSLGERGQLQFDKLGSMTGSQDALGRRSEESVQSIVQRNRGRLLYIYRKYLKHNNDFSGKVVLEIVIEADGRVSNVNVMDSTMENQEFQREILSFVRKWRFPQIEQGTVTVNFPLFFTKID